MQPLDNMRVLTLAINLPGPLAVAQLVRLGAAVVKVEPLEGDPLARGAPAWYQELHRGVEVVPLNLKDQASHNRLTTWLGQSDLLITASRLSGLRRLELSWPELHASYPRLCQVALVGYGPPREEFPGHDLTYQAELGLLTPPHLPRALMADWAGAQMAATAALALILARERGREAQYMEVRLSETGIEQALRHGLTTAGGVLGGGFPGYNLYPAREGWIAVATLEPHFWDQLQRLLILSSPDCEQLRAVFQTRTASEWETWAEKHGLPIVEVRSAPAQ
ncbi:MAG TPA: CoA transferase [Gemmataceae bacterium]|nr:CoA transferase [Gemmataceae bacterium]